MRNALSTFSFWLVIMVPIPAAAQDNAGMPDEAAVQTALDEHPSVMAARARVEAARADARALKA
ncbi:MAG: transporter, partial [Parasphingorhabdus sp.]